MVDLGSPSRHVWQRKVIGQCAHRACLQSSGSLTQLLKARYPDFVVKRLSEGWRYAFNDEWSLLKSGRCGSRYWVRDVCLMGGGQPRVFAHSVIPREGLRGAWRNIQSLGNRPLGNALFTNPRIRRGALSYCKLSRQHALINAMHVSGLIGQSQAVWARRSVFMLGRARLLVTEVFLPEH